MTKKGKAATETKSACSCAAVSTSQPAPIWSPPSSLDLDDRVVVATDERGMVIHDEEPATGRKRKRAATVQVKREGGGSKRRKLQYVSRHFQPKQELEDKSMSRGGGRTRKKRKTRGRTQIEEEEPAVSSAGTLPTTNILDNTTRQSRVLFNLDVGQLSSDSDLSDPPSDFENWPDPFTSTSTSATKSTQPPKSKKDKTPAKRKAGLTKSPYFPHAHKARPQFLSTLPFPPLHLPHFGLMQEKLAHDPFRLLLATIFLNKTPGQRAMPVFYELMARYPTPEALADAKQSDVTALIQCLGFQNQRAAKCIAMARTWCERPPKRGKRYRKLHYPCKGDGRDIKEDEVLGDEDELLDLGEDAADDDEAAVKKSNKRVAWEISHLPGIGAYGHDSWRMFCRDQLRELSSGWNGEDPPRNTRNNNKNHKTHNHNNDTTNSPPFEPEWKRVLPLDKELRAWMTWMWMKEGWVWDKETGQRSRAPEELMALAQGDGNVVLESGRSVLEIKPLVHDAHAWMPKVDGGGELVGEVGVAQVQVQTPAGEFVPET